MQIGDIVITTKTHKCLARTFKKGTKVKIIEIDDIRGFGIENEQGEQIVEIGWEI